MCNCLLNYIVNIPYLSYDVEKIKCSSNKPTNTVNQIFVCFRRKRSVGEGEEEIEGGLMQSFTDKIQDIYGVSFYPISVK